MKPSRQPPASVLVIGTLLLGFAISPAKAAETVPQAEPVIALLEAARDGDQKRLQSAFCAKIREQYDKVGWDKVLKQYQEGFKAAFGSYEVDDFTFVYKGSGEAGALSIVHKGKVLPGMAVIKEMAEWKLNER